MDGAETEAGAETGIEAGAETGTGTGAGGETGTGIEAGGESETGTGAGGENGAGAGEGSSVRSNTGKTESETATGTRAMEVGITSLAPRAPTRDTAPTSRGPSTTATELSPLRRCQYSCSLTFLTCIAVP